MSVKQGTLLAETSVSADFSELRGVRQMVGCLAHQAHLCEQQTNDLKLAVSEACANAIEHPKNKDRVKLAAWLEPDRLMIEIRGSGEFRMRPLESTSRRGFGLPLMANLVDEVRFTRIAGGGTSVQLSMLLPALAGCKNG